TERVSVSRSERSARTLTAEHPDMVRMVDYRTVATAVHVVLERRVRRFMNGPSTEMDEFDAWRRSRPDAVAYARFRATVERTGTAWRVGPARLRDGELRASEGDQATELRPLYAQWEFERQLGGIVTGGRTNRFGSQPVDLAFDLPLGVHPDGFDAWRERD